MAPTPQTIVISPDSRLVTIPNPGKISRVAVTSQVQSLPKYAVGLFDSNGQGPRKRKRLTHLTPEEKIMRRKLKNRVAAQTARDRKKVRMECLEETISKVQEQAKQLLDVNMRLLERAEVLERENAELKSRLGISSEQSSTVSQNRLDVEKIKIEFDETMASNLMSNANANMQQVPESILSPDESSDENDNQGSLKRKAFDFQCVSRVKRQCVASVERASPEPAAGCCQTDADPLDRGNACVDLTSPCTEDDESKDILGLLEQVDAGLDSKALDGSFVANRCIGSEQQVTQVITAEQLDSIKELISIDHHYSKPKGSIPIRRSTPSTTVSSLASKPVQVQLSRSTRSTKLIRQHSHTSDEDQKPTALCEKPASNGGASVPKRQNDDDSDASTHQDLPPMLCQARPDHELRFDDCSESSSLMDFENLDAELDFLLNDGCEEPAEALTLQKPTADLSKSTMLETPTTLGEEFLFGEGLEMYGSCLNEPASTELFPQLASFVL